MKNYKITMMDSLKAVKAANRETQHMPKRMVTLDKRKEKNKRACRDFKFLKNDSRKLRVL